MALSEATSVVPPNPETPSTNHAHSDQGSLPSSPDPDPTPSDLHHAILDELQKLNLKEQVEEGDAEPDELQKLDSTEKVEDDGAGELQKVDLKEEEGGAGKLQKVDLKEEEGGEGVQAEEKSSGEREVEILNGEENERQSEQSYQSDGGGGGEGWGGNQGWEEDGGEVEEKKAEETEESNRRYQYPVRPEAEDCSYYLKTGSCKFGSNCKFNHPARRKTNPVPRERVKDKDESPENPSQMECKYYLRSGGCKYGKDCRYSHSKMKPSVAPVLELNFMGLPIRPGERECPYYMRNGSCKYASNCRFNHPVPTTIGGSDHPPSGFGKDGPASLQVASQSTVALWSAPRPLNEAPVYTPMMIPPPQGVSSQNSEWNGYRASAYIPERSMPARPPYMMNNSMTETNVYKQYPHQNQVEEFPERPGQPDCSYFLRMGDCKFKSNCKYHHPKTRTAVAPLTLSDKGLPLRPDQNICTHYSLYGICKFGPACKFDHPFHISSSTTSVPDHQLPFGDWATTNGAGIAGSRSGTDGTSQPQPVQ